MTDLLDESLYKIYTETQGTNDIVKLTINEADQKNSKNTKKNATSAQKVKPNIMKLPKDRGITGLAIKK